MIEVSSELITANLDLIDYKLIPQTSNQNALITDRFRDQVIAYNHA